MSTPITTVVFDIGNVLIEWNPEHLYSKLIPNKTDRKTFLDTVCTMEWNLQQDLGRPWSEAVALLCACFPEKSALIEAYHTRWHEMVPGAISESVEILERLKSAGVPLYAITNFSREKFDETLERFSFLKTSFQDIVVSGDEKLAKPDPKIYQALFLRNALDAERCLFIDDSLPNVLAARDLGMKAHHFKEATALKRELIELDLLKG